MRIEPEISGSSIVLLGDFNPAIFSPSWFAKYGIVSQSAADEAETTVIHPELAVMQIGSKSIKVEKNRFTVDTNEAPFIHISDFVVKTFGEFLTHTPASKIGINRLVHFGVGKKETRDEIGRLLAPTGPWGEWGARFGEASENPRNGMISVIMHEHWEEDGFEGHFEAKVEPSTKLPGKSGIYVQVNHHCEVSGVERADGCEKVISYLSDRFEKSNDYSDWIIDQIMKLKDQVQ